MKIGRGSVWANMSASARNGFWRDQSLETSHVHGILPNVHYIVTFASKLLGSFRYSLHDPSFMFKKLLPHGTFSAG